ncbi:MAG: hypothetical protein ACE5MM_10725 [Nitrospiraceae bacterium]
MKLRTIAAAAVLTLVATPALAFHCPSHMKAIDDALAENPPLTAEQKAWVEELRAAGEALHNGGQHYAAVAALHRAMDILSLDH